MLDEPAGDGETEAEAGGGVDVEEAADGEAALAAIAASPPDAVVLDLLMPGIDGFEVLERLQERAETRLLPVLILTAKQLTPAERRSLGRRAVGVLAKSRYSVDEVRRLVARAVGPRDGAANP